MDVGVVAIDAELGEVKGVEIGDEEKIVLLTFQSTQFTLRINGYYSSVWQVVGVKGLYSM